MVSLTKDFILNIALFLYPFYFQWNVWHFFTLGIFDTFVQIFKNIKHLQKVWTIFESYHLGWQSYHPVASWQSQRQPTVEEVRQLRLHFASILTNPHISTGDDRNRSAFPPTLPLHITWAISHLRSKPWSSAALSLPATSWLSFPYKLKVKT